MVYNIHYDVSAMGILIFSIAYILAKKGFRQRQNKVLFVLLCVGLCTGFFDILSSFADSYPTEWSAASRTGFNYGYLFFQNAMPYLLSCYIVYVVGLTYRLDRSQIARLFSVLSIPFAVCTLILISNSFTHFVFYFDEQLNYCHGKGINILYLLAYIYLGYIFFLLVRYGYRTVRATKYMLFAFAIVTTAAIITQMIIPKILIQLFVESLCLLGLLVTVDNEAEIVDMVTTCYNRQRFVRECVLGLENKANFDIIIINIPGLGAYNASVGIGEMNKMLRTLGQWLRTASKPSEVYYCDNGCFVILCDLNTDSESVVPVLRERFGSNFVAGRTAIKFRPNISVIRAGRDFRNLEQLMIWIGGNDQLSAGSVMPSDTAVRISDYKKELIMQQAIERALQFDEFEVLYQPIWDAKNNMISDAEALLRLYDEADDLISPEAFIPFAEKRGYIVEIGEYVFESVCRFLATHETDDAGLERIHINLSPYQCMNEMLALRFEEIRTKYNVPIEKIVLEISDSGTMENFDLVQKTVNSLSEIGYCIALDNFGKTGIDMNYISMLPLSILKFDREFFWRAESNLKANAFFAGTMRTAKEMNVKTVVLGVEAAAQKTLLQNYECDYLQGFYYQKPIPAEQFYRYCVGFNSKE